MGLKAAVICGILAFVVTEAWADNNTDTAQIIRRRFDDCVFNTVNSLVKKGESDPNLAAEQGFAACQTEERAIIALMSSMHVPQLQAEAMILNIRMQIKNTVRDVFANPAKYAFPAKHR